MPKIPPNKLIISRAINGKPGHYTIDKHPGLHLYVGAKSASWRIRYRPARNAAQRWHTITNDARNADFAAVALKATKILSALKIDGVDPKDKKPAEQPINLTLDSCFRAWLAHTGKRRRRALAPNSRRQYENIFNLYLAKPLGSKLILTLDREAIQKTIDHVKQITTNIEKKHRGLQATKALKLLSSVLEWCIDRGWIERNPCRGIELPEPIHNPEGKQHRPPTNDELRQLWTQAPHIMTKAQHRVLQLAILTGRRISEITGAQYQDAKLDQPIPCLFIPADREGNKPKKDDAVPLAPLALAIVRAAHSEGSPDTPLFLGAASRWTTSKVLTTARRAWGWPDPPVRFHDFRGLINDQLAALGVSSELRSRTLHHTGDLNQLSNTVYSAYDFMAERLRVLEQWEQRLAQIVL